MVVVKVWGGLGNQMFQYALYESYLAKGVSAKLDISFYKNHHDFNGFELERVFGVKPKYINPLFSKLVKVIGKMNSKLLGKPYKETDEMMGYFYNEVAELKFGYLKGYWQTEKYFYPCTSLLHEVFVFPSVTDEKNKQMVAMMQSTNSVSVHVRRGDYLEQNRNWAMKKAYYEKALAEAKNKINDPMFFVFSDDIDWVKNNLDIQPCTYIDWNKKDNSYVDMQLMSNCKHNIIANSSFSWWGAWLNKYPSKIVFAPSQWLPFFDGTRDIIPTIWEKIDS